MKTPQIDTYLAEIYFYKYRIILAKKNYKQAQVNFFCKSILYKMKDNTGTCFHEDPWDPKAQTFEIKHLLPPKEE